jgi:autotransporter family porin
MNKAFKIIWSISRQAWIVTGKLTRGKSKSSTKSTTKLSRSIGGIALAAGLSIIATPTWAGMSIFTWVGATGDWFDDDNWSGLAPTVNGSASIDNSGTAQVTAPGAFSNHLFVGATNASSLIISDGGTLESGSGQGSIVQGASLVDGLGSSWSLGILYIGGTGSTGGSLTISDQGAVNINNGGGHIVIQTNGSLNIGAATGETALTAGTTDSLDVQFEAATASLVLNHTDTDYVFSPDISGDGSVSVESGTSIFSGTNTYTGGTTISGGTLQIGNGGTIGSIAGDIVNNANLIFNRSDAVTYAGAITGTGSLTKNGTGTLSLTGTSDIDAGNTNVENGALSINSGGKISNGNGKIDDATGSDGKVTVTNAGSKWTNRGTLTVGSLDSGALTISDGGEVSNTVGYIGVNPDSDGSVTVTNAGSKWINSSTVFVGYFGTGTLTISDGGVVEAGAGTGPLFIASRAGSTGTVNIGAASGDAAVAAGTIEADAVLFEYGTGSLVFNHTDTAYDFASGIAGSGTVKLLAGTTRFTGDLTGKTGTMMVDGGTLAIHSGDTLSLGGDYTQTASGILSIGVADDTTFGKLAVTGTATLPSNAKIDINVADADFNFTATSMANAISAGTLVSDGTFAVSDNSLLFNFGAVKNGDAVDLTIAVATDALASTTSQGKTAAAGAAAAIDNIISDDPTGEIAGAFVGLTTDKQVADAVESVLAGASGGMAQLTNTATGAVTDVVSDRQNSKKGLSSGDSFMTDRHVWLKPFGSWAEQDNRQGVTGYDIDSYGLAMGVDGDISSSWNVGAAFAYINSDVESNLAAGSHQIDMDSYLAKVYATMTFDATTALNLQAGVGISDYDSSRRLFTGDVANADYDSWNTQLSAELERSFQVNDKTVMTPYVHADYSYVNVDGYTESGAGALSLNVDDDSADSLIIGTGVKANHTVSDSLSLLANAGIGYDVMTDRSSLTSGFAGGGAQFTTDGIEPDEWVYNAGVGAKYSLANGTEITAAYTVDARQDYTDQSLSANFRMMF